MKEFIQGIFAFSRAISDFNIQIILIILTPIMRTRAFKFCNRPLSVVFAPIVVWWRHKPDVAAKDNAHYFASCRNRPGIYGRGNYTRFPIVKTTEVYSIEIEELMKDRLRSEPNFFMGTREEVLVHIKNVKNEDFDNALTMAHYRISGLRNNVEEFANTLPNPQTAFRHWLATQVEVGKISAIDGYVFVQRSPDAPMKNCEVGDFLYKYYDSFEAARTLNLHESYRNVDVLAKYLLGEILKESLAVGPRFVFEEINVRIRDRQISALATMECNPVIASEPVIPGNKIVAVGSYNKPDYQPVVDIDNTVDLEVIHVSDNQLLTGMDVQEVRNIANTATDYLINNNQTDLKPITLDEITEGSKAPSAFSRLVGSNHVHLGSTTKGETLSDEGKSLERVGRKKPTVDSITHPNDIGEKGILTTNVNDGNFLEVGDLQRLNTSVKNVRSSVVNGHS